MLSFSEFRQQAGCDLVGVPPLSCFDGLPPGEDPRSLFPDTRSVVVLGTHLRRGQFRAMEEGTLWQTPGRWLTSVDGVIRLIESLGYECVPYTPLEAPRLPRQPVRPGLCAPNAVRLSVDYAAVAAGLGDIGYHGMFMSERYGIRQMLGLLVTDLEIEPSPPRSPQNLCDRCLECVRHCPLQAISAEETTTLTCRGRTQTLGLINANACRVCPNGACGDSRYFPGADELHFDIENNQIRGDTRTRYARGGLPNRLSAACGRACIAHFEATHPTGYRLPFRSREPWGFRPDQERGW